MTNRAIVPDEVHVAATIGGLVGSLGSLIALIALMDKILSAYNG